MDIDEFMKSHSEDQMEMMLMHMDKLQDFSGSYPDINEMPPNMKFNNLQSWYNDNNTNNSSTHLENLHISSPAGFAGLHQPSTISFSGGEAGAPYLTETKTAEKRNSMAAMREMIFRIAAMQPIHIDPESVKPPKRRNVKISTDPQSVAARHRRERISERIRILQRLVPGGTKMDTASMLDEAIHYVKFLKNQVQSLERVSGNRPAAVAGGMGFPVPISSGNYFTVGVHHQSSPSDADS